MKQSPTRSIHIRIQVKLGNVLSWDRFQPDCLPDTTTGRIPDKTTTIQCLFPDGDLNSIHVCRIVHMYQPNFCPIKSCLRFDDLNYSQLICPVAVQEWCHINSKLKVSTPMRSGSKSIHEDGCLIINSAKVQQYVVFPGPVGGNMKCSLVPTPDAAFAGDTCTD